MTRVSNEEALIKNIIIEEFKKLEEEYINIQDKTLNRIINPFQKEENIQVNVQIRREELPIQALTSGIGYDIIKEFSRDIYYRAIDQLNIIKKEDSSYLDSHIICQSDHLGYSYFFHFNFCMTIPMSYYIKQLEDIAGQKLFSLLKKGEYFKDNDLSYTVDLFEFMNKEKEIFKKKYGSNYKMVCVNKLIKNHKVNEKCAIYFRPEEVIMDEVLKFKNRDSIDYNYIKENLIETDKILFDDEDNEQLLIKMPIKNKKLLSNRWCIHDSNTFFKKYNSDEYCQHVYYDFKSGDHIGFNYDGIKVGSAFDWDNRYYKEQEVEKLLTKLLGNKYG